MADNTQPIRPRAAQRLAAEFGFTAPAITAEQRAAHQARLADGDTQVEHLLARRTPHAA